jgi:hypothetical protein
MVKYVHGAALSVWLRPGAQDSWDEAERAIPGHRGACPANFRAKIDRLAAVGWLRSPDHMNEEGNGIHAVKARCGLRGYGWFDSVEGRKAFVISHVKLKRTQRLDPAERARAEQQREMFRAERERQNRRTQ